MRKLDDIIPPSRRQGFEMPAAPETRKNEPLRAGPRPQGGFPYRTALIALIVTGAVVGALFYFSAAKVTITPTSSALSVSSSYTATQGQGDLPFEVVSAQKVASQSVTASGTKAVSSSASGTVTIYNTQSKAQALVTNTRFATKSGLIFRIHAAITVPAGSTSKPGQVTATIYADQPGESYNVDATTFTLPGLSGSAQFSQVYAKSTAPMTGGASGNVPGVDPATEASARTALIAALGPDLMNELRGSIPAGYVLIPGAATTTYTAQTSAPSATTGMVDLKEQGVITAVVFPMSALAKAVGSQTLGASYTGGPATLNSVSGLILSSASTPTSDLQSYTFTLSGTTTLVYTVDPARIAAAVAGKTRALAEVALTNYPEVKRAILVLHPFWRTSFPEDPAAISIEVGNP